MLIYLLLKGAFTNFLTVLQNIDKFIKETCKKEKIEVKKLPFKLEEYRLVTQESTFLDIGSGFGKPNFHVAMQVFPKESIGIEIVPARVAVTLDQKLNFEDYYKKFSKKEVF